MDIFLCWFSFALLLFLSWPVNESCKCIVDWLISQHLPSVQTSCCYELYRAECLTYFICQMWSTEEIWSDSQVRDSVSSIKIVLAHLCGNRLGRVCSWVQTTHLLTQAVKSDLSSISYPAEAGDHSIAVSPTREPNLDQSCSGLGVIEQIPELTLMWS